MKFAELLCEFQRELEVHYGTGCEITKIAINRKAFERVKIDAIKNTPYYPCTIPSCGLNEMICLGVPVLIREKDNF